MASAQKLKDGPSSWPTYEWAWFYKQDIGF